MAVNPLYLISVREMIQRLRDPYRLSDAEQFKLDSYLTLDEKIEVEKLRQELLMFNELMLTVPLWEEFEVEKPWHAFSHMNDLIRTYNLTEPALDKRIERGNPGEYDYENAVRLKASMVDGIFRAYDRLPELERLRLEHRGARVIGNLPRLIESWENVYWPKHPNSRRQAYIEVLQAKLDRLSATL